MPGVDEPAPVQEHEQGSTDMQNVRGAKEVSVEMLSVLAPFMINNVIVNYAR